MLVNCILNKNVYRLYNFIEMNALQIRLFGDFVVTQDGEPIDTLSKPRLQSLLAYLLLHREAPQFRYHLAGLLWPDSSEDQAHTNLRNLVHLLRRALPTDAPLVLFEKQTLQWNPKIAVTVDAFEFERLAGQGSPQNLSLENLEAALQLYQGDLLPNCYDEWVSAERGHYRKVFITLLDRLIERYEGLRRYPEAVAACQRLVESEPFHKDGYSRLMRLQVLSGDAHTALKTYRQCARLLKHELALEPPSEMQSLAEHLRRAARQADALPAPALWPGEQLPLVGRTTEWQALIGRWRTAAAGQARMIFILGEAGIGKTRLVEELAAWATRQGIRTAVAHCYASEGGLPYAPAVAWLRALNLPPLEPVWIAELSRLLPELLKRNTKPPPPLTEAWQRVRLFEALARAVLGAGQKTLLLIEDLHWCDQDTLEWLHYLLRFDPQAPILVVGTARSEEIEANLGLEHMLACLRQEGGLPLEHGALEIELGRLSQEETGQLAAHAAGKALESRLGALIYQETEGCPLFIVETVRAELFKQGGIPGVQPLPYKTRAVLEHRIRQLSPVTHDLCLLAATIGRSFSLAVLRRACILAEPDLIRGLEELLHRRVVREIGQNSFDFSHDKLRDAALAGASGARRQMLHRQVADALVDLAGSDLENRSGEIAGHYDEAGSAGLAIHYYRMAGENARKIYANQRALQYYQQAIALYQAGEAGSSHSEITAELPGCLYEELGDVLALVGKFQEARAAYEHALSQGVSSEALWRAQVYRKISAVLIQEYQRQQALDALDLAEQALGLSPEEGLLTERQEWIQIQLARSNTLYWLNQPEEMDAIHRRICSLVDVDGRLDQQAELLDQQLMARFRHERYRLSAETVETARRRLALVNKLGVPYDIGWAQFHMGFALLWYGDPLAARKWLELCYAAAMRMGARLLEVRSLTYLSIASRQLGDAQSLREQSLRLYELAKDVGEFHYQGISLANQGWLAWREGDYERAEQLCASAKEIWRQKGGGIFHWLAEWVLLAVAVARQDLLVAEECALALLNNDSLVQPILDPVARRLEEALQACRGQQTELAAQCFNQALEMVKNSGDL